MRRIIICGAVLFAALSYGSLVYQNWPLQMDTSFIVYGGSTSSSQPILTSISPSKGMQGSIVTVVATGSNFLGNATISLTDFSPPFLQAGNVTVLGTTLLTTDLMIPPAKLPVTLNFSVIVNGSISNSLPFTVTPGPTCDVELNKSVFVNGEQVIVQSLQVTNPASLGLPVEFKSWIDAPGSPAITFSSGGSDGSIVLAAGFQQNLGPFPLGTVAPQLSRGVYAFGCRFLDTVRGNVLTESVKPFVIQ